MNVGEDMEEMDWIEFSETISHRIHAGKYQVETATSQVLTHWPYSFLLGFQIIGEKKLIREDRSNVVDIIK